MIVPDVNLLLYSYDTSSPAHTAALAWWRACLTGDEAVGLVEVVVFGFLRVATSPRVYSHPMTVAEAGGHVRSWLKQPMVRVLDSTPKHVDIVLGLVEAAGTAANLVTDAQIAAAALEHGGVVHTTDTDFMRFPGVRWFNPLTREGRSSAKSKSSR